jgi:hypothetical protein
MIFRRYFNLLCWEGAFAMAYDAWVGPLYLSGLAGELRVPVIYVTLFAALPWVGQVGQIIGLKIFERVRSYKRYTLILANSARALWLIPPLTAGIWGLQVYLRGTPFPVERWFVIVALVASSSALLGSSGGVSWMAWMRGLIPLRFQGRFFGTKSRFSTFAIVSAHLLGALWVGWKPGGYYLGYGVIAVLAVMAAFTSSYLLWKVPDVRQEHADREIDLMTSGFVNIFFLARRSMARSLLLPPIFLITSRAIYISR